MVEVPNGASHFQALADDLFAATFNGARANLIAFGPIGRIIHAVAVIGEVSEGFGGGFSGPWMIGEAFEGGNDGLQLTIPQIGTDLLDPKLLLVFRREGSRGDGGNIPYASS